MKIGILCEGELTDAPVLKTLLQSQFSAVDFFIRGVSKAIIFTEADLLVREAGDLRAEAQEKEDNAYKIVEQALSVSK